MQQLNNDIEIGIAKSTEEAKEYLFKNPYLLEYPPQLFCMITDRSRLEGSQEDIFAGSQLYFWLRNVQRARQVPVLVYCMNTDAAKASLKGNDRYVAVTGNPNEALQFAKNPLSYLTNYHSRSSCSVM